MTCIIGFNSTVCMVEDLVIMGRENHFFISNHLVLVMKILLVEDDHSFRDGYGGFLSRRGYEVDVAHNATQARDRIFESSYDAIIVDAGISGLSRKGARRYRSNGPQDVLEVARRHYATLPTMIGITGRLSSHLDEIREESFSGYEHIFYKSSCERVVEILA